MKKQTAHLTSITLLLFTIFLALPTLTNGQDNSTEPDINFELGKGLSVTSSDGLISAKLGIRLQNLYSYVQNLDDSDQDILVESEIRRLRFMATGYVYSPKIRYNIHHSLDRGNLRLFMAFLEFQVKENLKFGVGQFKSHASRQFLVSSGNLAVLDRSTTDQRFMLFFDQGIYLKYNFDLGPVPVKTFFDFTAGEGINTHADPKGYQYVARVDFHPLGAFKAGGAYKEGDLAYEEDLKIALGGAYTFNNNTTRTDGERGTFLAAESFDLETIFLDGVAKYQGASLSFMYTDRTNSGLTSLTAQPAGISFDALSVPVFEGNGYYVQAGYIIDGKHGIFGRVEHINPADDLLDNVGPTWNKSTKVLGNYTLFMKGHTLKWQIEGGLIFNDRPQQDLEHLLSIRTQFHINF
jgi:hypothetical protein